MLKKIIILFIIFTIMICSYKDSCGAKMPDYIEVYNRINDIDYLRKINLVLFILSNTCEHRFEMKKGTNIDFFKKMNICIDKIYTVNNSTYTFNNKITYYFYRATFTSKYSEAEAIQYWKKYLYITIPATEIANSKGNINLTLEAEGAGVAFKFLKKENVSRSQWSRQDMINYIKNDTELKNDKDINNLKFE